ncbi:thioredoxin family protein [Leifsonia sp. YIM 134122]|uniref:Thioredoxin family protein n=1 Tax=Leifsonia stereocauli TaxID=3134136 RepID=A0ABU9W2R4_9MICO
MTWIAAIGAALVLVGATTALGFWLRSRDGRITVTDAAGAAAVASTASTAATQALSPSSAPPALVVTPADVDSDEQFGENATLLQFSTEFCSRCPQTRVVLGAIAGEHVGVRHLDVDLTHRPDIARRYNVLQTPTTLILDGRGTVRARVGGAPDRRAVSDRLTTIIGSPA